MPTKKQKSTKTASKKTISKGTHRKATTRTASKKSTKELSNTERWHVYIVTGLGMIAAILLCADVAMMNVA